MIPRSDRPRAAGLGRCALAALALAGWEAAAGPLRLAHGLVPPPSAVLARAAADGAALYAGAAAPTLGGAALGWLLGNAAGVALAVLAAAAPVLSPALAALAVTALCVPAVALGPVLAASCSPCAARVALAALPVACLTMGALASRGAAVPAGARAVVRACGGGRLAALRWLDLPAAVPDLFTALRVSVPFAILGAVSAEFLGADRGLGVLLVTAQHRLAVDRAWAAALVIAGAAALASAAFGWLGRWAAPWSGFQTLDAAPEAGPAPAGRGRAARVLVGICAGSAVLAAWWGASRLTGLPRFVARGPLDVAAFLADPVSGADHRLRLLAEMAATVGDVLAGLTCGTAVAAGLAAAAALFRPLHPLVIGPALAAQCLPLVTFTPLVVLAFGRGPAAVVAIGAIVTAVPLVLGAGAALDGLPPALRDLARVNAAPSGAVLLRLLVPAALPALLAALRAAVPLAGAGALLAEGLATGRGAGYGLLTAAAFSDFDAVWARVAAATVLILALHRLFGAAEAALAARRGGQAA